MNYRRCESKSAGLGDRLSKIQWLAAVSFMQGHRGNIWALQLQDPRMRGSTPHGERPLVGLSEELAQQAWLRALSRRRDGYVPGRMVQRAVKQVLKTERPAVVAQANADKQRRCDLRRSVRTGFQELLTLLLGNAQREVVIGKVQEIQRLVGPFRAPKKRSGKILTWNSHNASKLQKL